MSDETRESRLQRTKGSVVRPQTARILAKLGKDIEFARRVRNIPAEKFAQAAGISRATLHRLESGEPGISLNTLAMALTVLGKIDLLGDLIDIRNDDIGISILRQGVQRRTALLDGQTEKHERTAVALDAEGNVMPNADYNLALSKWRPERVKTMSLAVPKDATAAAQRGSIDQVVAPTDARIKALKLKSKSKSKSSSGAITLILSGKRTDKSKRPADHSVGVLRRPKATDSASEF